MYGEVSGQKSPKMGLFGRPYVPSPRILAVCPLVASPKMGPLGSDLTPGSHGSSQVSQSAFVFLAAAALWLLSTRAVFCLNMPSLPSDLGSSAYGFSPCSFSSLMSPFLVPDPYTVWSPPNPKVAIHLYIWSFIVGGQILLPILLATFVFSKDVKRHPTLLNLLFTLSITSVFSSLLCVTVLLTLLINILIRT